MVTYEVQEMRIASRQLQTDVLRGFYIESPQVGDRGNIYVLHIVGWVLGRRAKATSVEVVYHDRVIRTAQIRGARADVEEYYPELPHGTECNFHLPVGLIGLKPESEFSLVAVLDDGTRAPLAEITVTRSPLMSSFEPTLQPIMLTCLGRSGTTWLMRILAVHERIMVYRRFPYESAVCKYWMHALRVLTEPANIMQSSHPDNFHSNLWWIGHNPYYDESVFEQPSLVNWMARGQVERFASFCQQSVEDWYMTLARSQEQKAPLYFAEKHMWPNYLPVLTWELYPKAKEIFLIRDFRDVASSILAFDRKRGFAGFGRPAGASDEQYLRGVLRDMALHLRKSWRTRGERGHLVRYEDLIMQPVETLMGVFDYLELENSPATIEHLRALAEQEAALQGHRTISDGAQSIGRWRSESESLQALYQDVFADVLEDFGYAEAGYVR